jgi:hypothetical protein
LPKFGRHADAERDAIAGVLEAENTIVDTKLGIF